MASLCLQRHSAVSLRNITTEVLKVLNATEELLHGVEGGSALPTTTLPPNMDPKKLDQQFAKLEENVRLRHCVCVCVCLSALTVVNKYVAENVEATYSQKAL